MPEPLNGNRVLSRSFSVGGGYTCTLRYELGDAYGAFTASAEWRPNPPVAMTDAETADYRAGLDALLLEVAEARGPA